MQIKELKSVLYSQTGNIQQAIVYDLAKNKDLENGCSIDYAVKEYGDIELKHIQADKNMIVLVI